MAQKKSKGETKGIVVNRERVIYARFDAEGRMLAMDVSSKKRPEVLADMAQMYAAAVVGMIQESDTPRETADRFTEEVTKMIGKKLTEAVGKYFELKGAKENAKD